MKIYWKLLGFFTFVRNLCLFFTYKIYPISYFFQNWFRRKFFCLHIYKPQVFRFNLCNVFEKKSHKSHFPMPFHTSRAALQKIAQRISGVFKRKLLYELWIRKSRKPWDAQDALFPAVYPILIHAICTNYTKVPQVLRTYVHTYFNRKIFLK